ncbi:hypothetical protein FM105_06100 [Brevibacterium yomogidense]|uniref:Uncharacterized protein n=1 Tax=Brevibacterium yomogidense TaxID=946573 RepID=A0A1X6XBP3_9MICO|nr:hypothetical protein FM105_06100 [Brevibacterium yomogidense]
MTASFLSWTFLSTNPGDDRRDLVSGPGVDLGRRRTDRWWGERTAGRPDAQRVHRTSP